MSCSPGSVCFERLKRIPTALVALAIGIIAALIAVEQWRVAKAKLKLDLFDKRYAIFLDTWKLMSEIVAKGTREQNYGLGNPFSNYIPQARFLFGKDIEDYLLGAVKKWLDLRACEALVGQAGEKASENAAKKDLLFEWFMTQSNGGVKELFGKYLNFERWI